MGYLHVRTCAFVRAASTQRGRGGYVASLPRGKDDPDFRGAVAVMVARVLEAEVALGASLGIRARWKEGKGRFSGATTGELDLRTVRDWEALGAFLGAATTVETHLVDGDACARDTALERRFATPPSPSPGDEPEFEDDMFVTTVPLPMPVRVEPKVGRNDACPCGSGKKFKKCCGG